MDDILAKANNGINLFNPPALAGGNSGDNSKKCNLLNRNAALAHSTKMNTNAMNTNAALAHSTNYRHTKLALAK